MKYSENHIQKLIQDMIRHHDLSYAASDPVRRLMSKVLCNVINKEVARILTNGE